MAASQETRRTRVALPTAIAGLLGTLAGTVVGGLISLQAVQATIEAEADSELRASRKQAYSLYASDLTRHVQLLGVEFRDDNWIDEAEGAALDKSSLEVARSYAAAALVGTDSVRGAIEDVNDRQNEWEGAARQGKVPDYGALETAFAASYVAFFNLARKEVGAD